MLLEMFPSDRTLTPDQALRVSERWVKAIYIHSHMDEESFDVARIMRCSVGVPEVDGSNIPTCSYNVLYREKDARFSSKETLTNMDLIRPSSLIRAPHADSPDGATVDAPRACHETERAR
jgi:hypothetical protein